jgi:hypothetical protein
MFLIAILISGLLISLNSVKMLIVVMKCSVLFEVRTSFVFKGLMKVSAFFAITASHTMKIENIVSSPNTSVADTICVLQERQVMFLQHNGVKKQRTTIFRACLIVP